MIGKPRKDSIRFPGFKMQMGFRSVVILKAIAAICKGILKLSFFPRTPQRVLPDAKGQENSGNE
jgi:hypothetical protein